VSTLPGGNYGAFSGTSMAAPMVSGAAALLWAATPAATYSEVKGALLDTSDGPNDGVTGFRNLARSDGRLNVERAIYTRHSGLGELRASTIVSAAEGFIVVQSPRGTPGLVDVTVSDGPTGESATYPDGYLYVGPDSPTTTTAEPASTTTAAPPSTTSAPPTTLPPEGGGIDDWLDGVLVTPDGLTLAPVDPNDPMSRIPVELWAGSLCEEPVCPGWLLGS